MPLIHSSNLVSGGAPMSTRQSYPSISAPLSMILISPFVECHDSTKEREGGKEKDQQASPSSQPDRLLPSVCHSESVLPSKIREGKGGKGEKGKPLIRPSMMPSALCKKSSKREGKKRPRLPIDHPQVPMPPPPSSQRPVAAVRLAKARQQRARRVGLHLERHLFIILLVVIHHLVSLLLGGRCALDCILCLTLALRLRLLDLRRRLLR
ncbi:uncharacterized protein BKA78DRAFT_323917 [Phyllosticta capitalensis]|uniref:uncharacterized protein n=1 Tax=Phyllosticta capitalensis TaxID=121624 RepID=UPI003130983F